MAARRFQFPRSASMNNMAKSGPLYREVLRSIYSRALEDLRNPSSLKVFISGGRGLGKTFLIKELAESRSQGAELEGRIIEGLSWQGALQSIADSHKNFCRWRDIKAGLEPDEKVSMRNLLIDDIDRLIFSVGTQEPSAFKELMANLLDLITGLPESGRFCAFTSLFHANRLAELLELMDSLQKWDRNTSIAIRTFSGFIQMYEHVQLKPWSGEWRKGIKTLVKTFLYELSPAEQEICRSATN